MAGFDFGSFFGGGSNSSGGLIGSFNFSDYNSIKNGSYRRLVKSYYAKDKIESEGTKAEKSKDKDTKKITKVDNRDTTGLSKMKRESDALVASVDALDNKELWTMTNGKYDVDKITDAVKSFVNGYNKTISQSLKVTNADVSQQISNMESMTSTMAKTLSKVGITMGADGKLVVNEDKLKGLNMNDVKELFDGSHSYASQIQKFAQNASKAAVNGASIYSANGSLSSTIQGLFNNWV